MATFIKEESIRIIETDNKDVIAIRIGEQGPPGISEAEMDYERRTDYIDDFTLYKGKANPGIADSEPFWKIVKITISPIDDDVIESWADGVTVATATSVTPADVWDYPVASLTDRATIGGYVARSLLSLKNFLGNK